MTTFLHASPQLPSIDLERMKPVFHNLGLIAFGSIICVISLNTLMLPHGIYGGGLTGLAILMASHWPGMSVGLIYLVLNIPLIALGWVTVNKRFVWYTLFGMTFFSLVSLIPLSAISPISSPVVAAVVSGVIGGMGCGLILRSEGTAGGLDIPAVVLSKRTGIKIGTIVFAMNSAVIIAGALVQNLESGLISVLHIFVCGKVINWVTAQSPQKQEPAFLKIDQ